MPLRRHIWKCGFCDADFRGEHHLDVHMDNKHPEEVAQVSCPTNLHTTAAFSRCLLEFEMEIFVTCSGRGYFGSAQIPITGQPAGALGNASDTIDASSDVIMLCMCTSPVTAW